MGEFTPMIDLDIERLVVIHNHRPDSAQLAEKCVDELRSSAAIAKAGISKIEQWQTVKGDYEQNADKLLWKGLRQGDALVGVIGDGTFRTLAAASALHPDMAQLGVPITSITGGNANDIRKSLHGWYAAAPSEIITGSRALTAHLIDVTTIHQRNIEGSYAASYVGCGKTALATRRLASDEYRNGRRPVQDAKIGIGALTSSHSFTIAMPGEAPITLGDQTISISPHMAKVVRFPTVRHWHPTLRVTPVRPGFGPSSRAFAGLLLGRAAGYDTSDPIVFDTHTDMPMHLDGEPAITVPAGSRVAISTGHHSYTVLASRYPLDGPRVWAK